MRATARPYFWSCRAWANTISCRLLDGMRLGSAGWTVTADGPIYDALRACRTAPDRRPSRRQNNPAEPRIERRRCRANRAAEPSLGDSSTVEQRTLTPLI